MKHFFAKTLMALMPVVPASAQAPVVDIEMQAAVSDGSTPLWLNANRRGVSSLEDYAFVRASLVQPMDSDRSSAWGYSYGVDAIAGTGMSSTLFVQQAFVEGRWEKCRLTVGSKEWPMEMKNEALSTGGQAFGINAHPVPQVRLAVADWCTVPYTKQWVQVKGHLAYGKLTDSNWQEKFAAEGSPYCSNTLYHSKAGYMHIAKPGQQSKVDVTLGIEMATLFGGEAYNRDGRTIYNRNNISAFWHAFVPGGGEVTDGQFSNIEGNQLGAWMARVDYHAKSGDWSLYADKFFEDQSSMFQVDYDGYAGANREQRPRMHMYDWRDWLLGAEWRRPALGWIDNVLIEFAYTKYQSGSLYHDHSSAVPEHFCGLDNFYNHYIFSPWQHWGQVMGNPLYLSPIYNNDGQLIVKNNRFDAYHIGFGGHPTPRLDYRVLATFQDGMGTYANPYNRYRRSFCFMTEATYRFAHRLDGWRASLALGVDRGNIHGNNTGVQLTVGKRL